MFTLYLFVTKASLLSLLAPLHVDISPIFLCYYIGMVHNILYTFVLFASIRDQKLLIESCNYFVAPHMASVTGKHIPPCDIIPMGINPL